MCIEKQPRIGHTHHFEIQENSLQLKNTVQNYAIKCKIWLRGWCKKQEINDALWLQT